MASEIEFKSIRIGAIRGWYIPISWIPENVPKPDCPSTREVFVACIREGKGKESHFIHREAVNGATTHIWNHVLRYNKTNIRKLREIQLRQE